MRFAIHSQAASARRVVAYRRIPSSRSRGHAIFNNYHVFRRGFLRLHLIGDGSAFRHSD